MKREELLKRIGSVEQIGGVRDFTFNDGKSKGVRAIEINTGNLCITVLPDRCMDIAQASFKGTPVSWISKTGITSPMYYEKDGRNFMRSFYGGLVSTCGLKNIGRPYGDYGLHDRIGNTPAENVSVFAEWVEDKYIIEVSGVMRQSIVFGENLVLKRTIKTELFSNSFILEDVLINEGFEEENIALAYHCNFGYPLVCEEARITNIPEEYSHITPPIHGNEEKCIEIEMQGEICKVGIENAELSVDISYRTVTLPKFLVWKMLGESDYVIGLEPRTTNNGGEYIRESDEYVKLKPFEPYNTFLKFEFNEK